MAIFLPLPGNEALAATLASRKGGTVGEIEMRRFPDGETYVRIGTEVRRREACIVCTLDRPDEKLLPILFAASTLRRLGSPRIRLVAPYLAYMRQDSVFRPGEALTSRDFAGLISSAFDGIVTVDPHLHRYRSLAELYACATTVVRAAPLIAEWIKLHVERPLIVGPDSESEQWAGEIAAAAGAPRLVMSKQRLGDRDVRLSLPRLEPWRDCQPVLVDDIVSSGATIIAAARKLVDAGLPRPLCVAIHGLFDEPTRRRVSEITSGLVTSSSIPNETSRIDLGELIASAL